MSSNYSVYIAISFYGYLLSITTGIYIYLDLQCDFNND
jgi:hypothetical protein